MLADDPHVSPQCGTLGEDVHLTFTSLYGLLDFIKGELPRWRDRSDRRKETSETILTSHLCAHLNSAVRHSKGWDILQFRVEEPDEQAKARKIDLVAAPCDTTIWIDGRRNVDFDTILPIECKRLPTPKGKERDEREYVFSQYSSTGGIQRFKAGHHGANHTLGAMIAYVQQETRMIWITRVTDWIKGLVEVAQPGWTAKDLLRLKHDDEAQHLAVFQSSHTRENGLPEIELRHLWVSMN
ncbi:MAG: hypothetical protein M0T69_08185 [Deltaproteobacteria bacterium]|nr:hypothetical protein [Deltaproteobacteria bacterium]